MNNSVVSQPKVAEKVVEEYKPVDFVKDSSDNNYMPIKAMNTFTKDWIIKARVSQKGELKTTKKGGYLLKLELVDSFGTQIEGTFFNDAAKQFVNAIEENKVYLFSNGYVKMAN